MWNFFYLFTYKDYFKTYEYNKLFLFFFDFSNYSIKLIFVVFADEDTTFAHIY